MIEITFPNGMIAITDDEFLPIVEKYSWCISPTNRFYVTASVKGFPVGLHRLVIDAPEHLLVDHFNSNPLDNRKCNLRLATETQNGIAKRLVKFKGTHRGIRRKTVENKYQYYGEFYSYCGAIRTANCNSVKSAMRAYDALSIQERDDFGFRHFPNGYEHILPDRLIKEFNSHKTSPIPYPEDYF